ncbi:M23 family metallopeptidase [Leptolyngbya sp. AN02str]|uniref:M23 family metallopeptidase n=1 Tax=Leptolyngbya sp. AN02str TaxID=3423363 RepID=UPI003D31E5EE
MAALHRAGWMLGAALTALGLAPGFATAQTLSSPATPSSIQMAQANTELCEAPALSRLQRHRIAPGETLVSLAQQYNLIPATLMGFNANLRSGNAPVGAEIVVPPYNGVQVNVPSGSSWSSIAESYGVRADVLFEINGCQPPSTTVFIPGVNWSPNGITRGGTTTAAASSLGGYPLSTTSATVTLGYGWQVDPGSGQVIFHSGVDLQANAGDAVLAAGSGTVAFVGQQGAYGNLIVINHAQGLQTRYAQLQSTSVTAGQTVRAGDRIGTVGSSGSATAPHLHFEVRSNSDLGWVAQNPGDYFRGMEIGR